MGPDGNFDELNRSGSRLSLGLASRDAEGVKGREARDLPPRDYDRGYENRMDDDEIDLKALFETMRRQAGLILATAALFVAGAIFYLFSVTPIFTATTLVLVDPTQKDILEPGAAGNVNQSFASSRVDSEVEIMRTDAVALTVVDKAKLINDPEFGPRISLREKFETAIGIRRDRETDPEAVVRGVVQRFKNATGIQRKGRTFLISVSVSSESPQKAADLANILASSYIEQQVQTKIRSSLDARNVLQKQINVARARLAESERALDEFIQANLKRIEQEAGRTDVTLLAEQLKQLESSRLQREVALRRSQEELAARDWASLVTQLESEALTQLERERASIRQRLGQVVAESQEAVNLRAELAVLESQLEEAARNELSALQQQVNQLGSQEEETRREIRNTLISGQLPPDLLARIFEIQQEAAIARAQYQNLLARSQDLENQAGVQIADSRVVSAAMAPTSPSFPNKKLVLALALVLGGGLGVFFGFLREFFVGGFTSSEQLQDALSAPVASAVPLAPTLDGNERTPADKVVTAPLSPYAEAIRRLRASIDHHLGVDNSREDGAPREAPVILITSTVPNEGKTTTALALSRTYALAGRNVLLIDADLRKPGLHRFLGVEPSSGFLEYLRNPGQYSTLEEFSIADPLSNATVILGKGRSATPTDQLVSSKEFEGVVKGARQAFDIIIIDSPPLLPVVDGRYLAKYADAVVMVVRWASTSQSELRAVRGPLRESMRPEAPLLAVMSHQEGSSRRKYAYYYGYGDEPV